MASTVRKNFDSPDEVRNIEKGRIEVVNLDGAPVMRTVFQPGWKWSTCVKQKVGTQSCEVAHLIYAVSGRMTVRMTDGTQIDVGPGDVASIPPGHDAWVVGNEAFVGVDFQGGADYAKAQQQTHESAHV